MRIGFIIYGSLDTLTGGYLYDRFVVKGLTERGHEVEVISLSAGSYFRRLLLGFTPALSQRLMAGKFDILIQDELCHPSLFLVNKRLRQQAGPRLIALVHHILSGEPRYQWKNRIFSLVERSFLGSVDGFIHNSKTTQKTVASLVAHNLPEVVAYPAGNRFGNPLTAEVIAKRCQAAGPLELIFLGIVVPRKGLLPLLSALAQLDSNIWRLSIVGGLDFDPDYTARVRKLTRQLGLSDSVRFLGPLQDDDLVQMLSKSHIFCMPYAYEGFGIAILEAMAFGLPAIGCSNGAAHETINHGENGFLLAPSDLAGLAPLLLGLHHDRKKLQQMALAAYSTYASRPSWRDNITAIEAFLCKITESPNLRDATKTSQNPQKSESGETGAPE